ncbi:MAG: TorF family putative porin [Verrucomicrobiota bacterium]
MKFTSLAILGSLIGFTGIASAGEYSYSAPAKGPVVPYEEEPLGFEVGLGYDSSYIFRGVSFGDHSVWASLDYAIPITDTIEFGLGTWYQANYDEGDSFEELDLIAGLSFGLGSFDLGLGVIWYYFPDDGSDALEIGSSLGTSVGPVDLGSYVAYDEATDGWYFEISAETTIELTDNIALVPGALISYGDDYYGVDGFNNVGLSLALPIALTDTATVTPYIAGSLALEGLDDIGEPDYFYGGISLSVTF